ncbi:Gfo/Idh/MocA family oxidoreductase [Vibrio sp. TH_r3]|uniref:Gfo/Idh/MocA family protein n=1 Tax=Vibrio sp. TH_r3 TaxID=3082084 RepID=UPI002953701F|nr:Gfo/Idh/MocA family oxidoreductase [Vibrio sp. TH_r3]MDV7103306.1 Gfo/Idh/MocA family oxidoreductase [Vibrio sp. TH_r3]
MEKKINWGIIAPGRIAHRFAQGFSAIEDGKLFAVASRNTERAQSFAQQYDIDYVMDSYEELIQHPDIDVIYIANPHRYHHETVKQCLMAGKAVLCEKPLTVTAQQSIELFELARTQEVFLMEAVWSRFLPCWVQVKQWLNEDLIGDIRLLQSNFGFQPKKDSTDRLFDLNLAGGALLDTGIYNIALSEFVLGRQPSNVQSAVLIGETGVDERCSVTMDYGEVTSQFTCTFLSCLDNEFHIVGEKGTIIVAGNFWDAKKATLKTNVGEVLVCDKPHRASGFEYQVEEVHRCLKNKQLFSTNMTPEITIANMQIMDKILHEAGIVFPFVERDLSAICK